MNTKTYLKNTLNKIFNKYKKEGLLSIYLWGSITTNDYNQQTSDIDIIGITSEESILKEEDVKNEIKRNMPNIQRVGFRNVSKQELESGTANDYSPLTKVIHPRILLLDLPNWEFVIGKKYEIPDFTDKPPTTQEVIKLRLDRISKNGWKNLSSIQPEAVAYYLKELMRIIHLLQILRGCNKQFSYKNIEKNATQEEFEVIKVFNLLRENNYNYGQFEKNQHLFNKFIKGLFL